MDHLQHLGEGHIRQQRRIAVDIMPDEAPIGPPQCNHGQDPCAGIQLLGDLAQPPEKGIVQAAGIAIRQRADLVGDILAAQQILHQLFHLLPGCPVNILVGHLQTLVPLPVSEIQLIGIGSQTAVDAVFPQIFQGLVLKASPHSFMESLGGGGQARLRLVTCCGAQRPQELPCRGVPGAVSIEISLCCYPDSAASLLPTGAGAVSLPPLLYDKPAALTDHIPSGQQLRMLFCNERHAVSAAELLVSGCQKENLPVQRYAATLEPDEAHDLHCRQMLCINRAPSPDRAAAADAVKRRMLP